MGYLTYLYISLTHFHAVQVGDCVAYLVKLDLTCLNDFVEMLSTLGQNGQLPGHQLGR